mgnify:CR=1 FL=1
MFALRVEKPLFTLRKIPNPAKNKLNIQLSKKIEKVLIYNVFGKLIYKDVPNLFKVEVNMDNISAGVYLVKVFSENGTITKRIIKN